MPFSFKEVTFGWPDPTDNDGICCCRLRISSQCCMQTLKTKEQPLLPWTSRHIELFVTFWPKKFRHLLALINSGNCLDLDSFLSLQLHVSIVTLLGMCKWKLCSWKLYQCMLYIANILIFEVKSNSNFLQVSWLHQNGLALLVGTKHRVITPSLHLQDHKSSFLVKSPSYSCLIQ